MKQVTAILDNVEYSSRSQAYRACRSGRIGPHIGLDAKLRIWDWINQEFEFAEYCAYREVVPEKWLSFAQRNW